MILKTTGGGGISNKKRKKVWSNSPSAANRLLFPPPSATVRVRCRKWWGVCVCVRVRGTVPGRSVRPPPLPLQQQAVVHTDPPLSLPALSPLPPPPAAVKNQQRQRSSMISGGRLTRPRNLDSLTLHSQRSGAAGAVILREAVDDEGTFCKWFITSKPYSHYKNCSKMTQKLL